MRSLPGDACLDCRGCLPACQSLNLSNNDMHGEFAREFAKSIRTVYEKGVITRVCNLLR